MATYKVIQDIEAEDKLVGPFSLRQFIYAGIVIVLGFIMFQIITKANFLLAIPFLPPAILFGFLAAPFGHDQSSEVWLLAKIRFMLKPRTRVWNQSGLQELVTITAPKKVERVLTNGLDQYQVQSRLQALAQTIDTRGWAVKGVNVSMFATPTFAPAESDRLVSADNFAAPVPDVAITDQDDILDTDRNPVAQQMEQLMRASTEAHKQELMDRMNRVQQPAASQQQVAQQSLPPLYTPPMDATPAQAPMYVQASTMPYASAPQATMAPAAPAAAPASTPTPAAPMPPAPTPYANPEPVAALPPATPVAQPSAADEAALLDKVHKNAKKKKHAAYGHMKVLETPEEKAEKAAQKRAEEAAKKAAEAAQQTSVTQEANPDILKLANNDDLTVATIARQVHKNDHPPEDEVVISLR